jgi:hypothetical protein
MAKSGFQMYTSWTQVSKLLLYPITVFFSSRWQGKRRALISCILYCIVSLEWTELAVTGSVPPPRCGHSATMIEKRLLIFGGRGDS